MSDGGKRGRGSGRERKPGTASREAYGVGDARGPQPVTVEGRDPAVVPDARKRREGGWCWCPVPFPRHRRNPGVAVLSESPLRWNVEGEHRKRSEERSVRWVVGVPPVSTVSVANATGVSVTVRARLS